ncbi:MAG: epoxyqueuosine reductase QueH [bacterium]
MNNSGLNRLPKLLLHVCCAPCSPHIFELLREKYDVVVFFYNPNIFPEEEYELRRDELKKFCKNIDVPFIEGKYDIEIWNEIVQGLENEPEGGKRCEMCFKMRLECAAQQALETGCKIFAATLTVSPHKNAAVINQIGEEAGEKFGITFLEADFKKKDGFKKSVELSRQFGFYRQNYCGCAFSRLRFHDSGRTIK